MKLICKSPISIVTLCNCFKVKRLVSTLKKKPKTYNGSVGIYGKEEKEIIVDKTWVLKKINDRKIRIRIHKSSHLFAPINQRSCLNFTADKLT